MKTTGKGNETRKARGREKGRKKEGTSDGKGSQQKDRTETENEKNGK